MGAGKNPHNDEKHLKKTYYSDNMVSVNMLKNMIVGYNINTKYSN